MNDYFSHLPETRRGGVTALDCTSGVGEEAIQSPHAGQVTYCLSRSRGDFCVVECFGMTTLLYRTVMGSRLYGLAHEGSDWDWLEVWTNAERRPARDRPRHTYAGDQDVVRMSLSMFTQYAARGSHQALEAMFAPPTAVDSLRDYRQAYRCDTALTVQLYRRTIRSFVCGGGGTRRYDKACRTALRMTYSLEEILLFGRFNPVVPPDRALQMLSMSAPELRDATTDRLHWIGMRFGV